VMKNPMDVTELRLPNMLSITTTQPATSAARCAGPDDLRETYRTPIIAKCRTEHTLATGQMAKPCSHQYSLSICAAHCAIAQSSRDSAHTSAKRLKPTGTLYEGSALEALAVLEETCPNNPKMTKW